MLDWVPRWLRVAFGVLVMGMVVWFLVIPQFGQAEQALDAITGVNAGYVLLGGLLVAAATGAQAELTRTILPAAERPSFPDMVRMELATTAVSHTVPGGTAAGTALGYRLLTQAGVPGSSAGFVLGVRGIGSALVLNVLLWAALLISIPTQGFDRRYTTAAVLGSILLTGVGGAVLGLLRAPDVTTRVLCRTLRPVPIVNAEAVPRVIGRLSEQLRDLVADRHLAVRAVGWAAAYWIALAAALWVLLLAFGWTGHPVSIAVAFGLVNVLAALPVTPRGLGVLEAVLIPMLVGFGRRRSWRRWASSAGGSCRSGHRSRSAPWPTSRSGCASPASSATGTTPPTSSARSRGEHREAWSEWADRHAIRRRP